MVGELAENVGQSPLRVRQLILQRVVMLLLQDAVREVLLDEILHWLQHDGEPADPDDHHVAITEPTEKLS